jgi:hypothetical protein
LAGARADTWPEDLDIEATLGDDARRGFPGKGYSRSGDGGELGDAAPLATGAGVDAGAAQHPLRLGR